MSKFTDSHIRIAIFILSLLLVAGGLVLLRQDAPAFGLLVILGGASGFLWSSARLAEAPPTRFELNLVGRVSFPFLLGLGAVLCSLASVYLVSTPAESASRDYLTSALWLVGVVSLAVAALWADGRRPPTRRQFERWWQAHWREGAAVALILLVALLARTVNLETHPYPWSGDEASIGMQARQILNGTSTNFFETSWSGQPNWSFLPNALLMRVFGENVFAVRMAAVLAGVGAVFFVYLLGREMFNPGIGLLASGFLAVYPVHVHFSRLGVHNIQDSLMVCLCLWLALRALRTRRISAYALTGIASGLTIYTYVGTRLVFALVVGVFVYHALIQRHIVRQQLAGLGMFVLSAIVTMAPMAYFFIKNPLIFANRIGQEGILFNGWLFDQAEITGQSVAAILADQFARSTLVFVASGSTGSFFNSPEPYLTLVAATFFLLGMAYSFLHIRRPAHAILLAWFWSVVFLGGVLTLNPPANTRMLMTAPAVALFLALGVWQLLEVLRQLSLGAAPRRGVAAALLIILAGLNAQFYLVDYPSNFYFRDRNGEVAQHAGLQVRELGRDYSLYMFGAPHVFTVFPTTAFIAADNPLFDPTPEELAQLTIAGGRGALFIAIPENEALLEQAAARFPGGERYTLMRLSSPGEVLYYGYVLHPATGARP